MRFLGRYVGEVEGEWNQELDAFFSSHAVPLKFSEIVSGNAVIDLPVYGEYPIVGSWSPQMIAAAASPIRNINLTALIAKDQELGKVVGAVADWVAQASKRPGSGIVGFSL